MEGANESTLKVDSYSFGIVMCEVAARMQPFHDVAAAQVDKMVLQGIRPNLPSLVRIMCIACVEDDVTYRTTMPSLTPLL